MPSATILLLTPPLIQANAPYPATAVLAASLRARGYEPAQADLSLALVLRLFSSAFLARAQSRPEPLRLPPEVVTATRLAGGAIAAPTATASVLDGDQLRAEGITHLADALRRVPGLSLARTSRSGHRSRSSCAAGSRTTCACSSTGCR